MALLGAASVFALVGDSAPERALAPFDVRRLANTRAVGVETVTELFALGSDQPVRTIYGQGEYDFAAGRGVFVQHWSLAPVTVVFDGASTHVRQPVRAADAQPWASTDRFAVERPRPESVGVVDPGRLLAYLDAGDFSVNHDAPATIEDGRRARRLRGSVGVSDAGRSTHGDGRHVAAARRAGLASVPVEVWLDDDGFLTKAVYTVELGGTVQPGEWERARYTLVFHRLPIGTAVELPAVDAAGPDLQVVQP